MYRPVLIVDGISDDLAILGWDTIVEEGFVIEGRSGQAVIEEAKSDGKWNAAALVTGQRCKLLPRSVHKLHVIAMTPGNFTLPEGEEGLCEPLRNSPVGIWDCISRTEANGKVFVTAINTGLNPITLQAGDQIGVMRNPRVTGEDLQPMDEHVVNAIFLPLQ